MTDSVRQGADSARLAAGAPRPMVFTNGVFDVLHAGHVECLALARSLGMSLVVGLNSDASARRLGKGAGRPLNNEHDRAVVLRGLASVSAVLLFDADTPHALMRQLRPDIYVKGGDYTIDSLSEAQLVHGWGGRTVIVPRLRGLSSSRLIERLGLHPEATA